MFYITSGMSGRVHVNFRGSKETNNNLHDIIIYVDTRRALQNWFAIAVTRTIAAKSNNHFIGFPKEQMDSATYYQWRCDRAVWCEVPSNRRADFGVHGGHREGDWHTHGGGHLRLDHFLPMINVR